MPLLCDGDIVVVAIRSASGKPRHTSRVDSQAFALEQSGDLAGAEAAGRTAVRVHRGDVWAHHAVAHAMYPPGRLAEGVQWMLSLAPMWTRLCSFMLTHNWWHVALFLVDMGTRRTVCSDDVVFGMRRLTFGDFWP